MAAISVSGLVDGGFRFLGFLPRSGRARREAVGRVAETDEAVVLFEAPQRVSVTLSDLAAVMPARDAMIGRELTKMHEELLRGTIADLAASAATREWLGEVTLVIGPRGERDVRPVWSDEQLEARIDDELGAGRRPRDVADTLALETGMPRRDLYSRVLSRRR
jgi:16S rRNA (cytidine1402-2'-O)-methyltransferase